MIGLTMNVISSYNEISDIRIETLTRRAAKWLHFNHGIKDIDLTKIEIHVDYSTKKRRDHWHGFAKWRPDGTSTVVINLGDRQGPSWDIHKTMVGYKVNLLTKPEDYLYKALIHELAHIGLKKGNSAHPIIEYIAYKESKRNRKYWTEPEWYQSLIDGSKASILLFLRLLHLKP